MEDELVRELEAWDALSDESWASFPWTTSPILGYNPCEECRTESITVGRKEDHAK